MEYYIEYNRKLKSGMYEGLIEILEYVSYNMRLNSYNIIEQGRYEKVDVLSSNTDNISWWQY